MLRLVIWLTLLKQDDRPKAGQHDKALSQLKIGRLCRRNALGRVILLPGTELRLVSVNKRQQNEEAFFDKHSWRANFPPVFPSFP